MAGRPPKWSKEEQAEIKKDVCRLIRDGLPLTKICKKKGFPGYDTIYKWFREDPQFIEDYSRARVDQADSIYYQIQEIEDKVVNGILEPNAGRVVINSMIWRAGKMKPKKYGDKLHVQDDVQISFNAAPVKKGKAK